MVPTNSELLLNNNTIKGGNLRNSSPNQQPLYQQPLSPPFGCGLSPHQSPLHSSNIPTLPISSEADMNSIAAAASPLMSTNGPPSSGTPMGPQMGANPLNTCGLSATTTTTTGMTADSGLDSRTTSTTGTHQQHAIPSPNPQVKSCAGCGGRICDRFLLHAMDRYWHTGCLKCSCCQAHLGEIGQTCFAKGDMILCKNDYIRMFGCSGTCSACSQSIPASEFVMKVQGNVYHVACFVCVACHNRLVPGDRYSIVNGNVICEHDYPKVVKGLTQIPTSRQTSHKVC